jgi:hypothetical protein
MTVSAHNAIRIASEFLPEKMLYPALRSGLRAPAQLIGNCCSSYYFEYHCDQPLQCDLLCSLTFKNSRVFLKRLSSRSPNKNDQYSDIPEQFLNRWNRVDTALSNRIPHVWLAFDFNRTENSFNFPNLHFCIDNNFTERSRQPDYRNKLTPKQITTTFSDIIHNCFSEHQAPSLPPLRRCLHTLDTGGEVLHLSFMHSRIPPVFKLNTIVPAATITDILTECSWPGDRRTISRLCTEFASDEPRIKCNFCFTNNISPRFEIELEYNTPLKSDRRRSRMITSLLKTGLITRTQAGMFRKWPGRTEITTPRGSATITFERWLDIKLVIGAGGDVSAKAYFGFAPLPVIRW